MTLSFTIRTDRLSKEGEAMVLLIYRHLKDEYKINTGVRVRPELWQTVPDNWISDKIGKEESVRRNSHLRGLRDKYQKIVDEFARVNDYRYPTKAEMKLLCDPDVLDKSFFGLFRQYITYQGSARGVKSVTMGTLENYEKVFARLTDFQTHTKKQFTFKSIDHGFHDAFTDYLTKTRNNQVNTIRSNVKILKAFLKWAELHHGIQIDPLVRANMKTTQDNNSYIYLHKYEVEVLAALRLERGSLYDRVRDAFVLQCYFGCRHSDISNLVKENIQVDGDIYRLSFKTKKNKRTINALVPFAAIPILKKYAGIDPKNWVPALYKVNIYIKEVCEKAGGSFLQNVQVVRGGGIFRKEEIVPRYKLVCSHTAVRTAINVMLQSGVPEHVILELVGKSARTLATYKHSDDTDIQKATEVWGAPKQADIEPEERGNN